MRTTYTRRTFAQAFFVALGALVIVPGCYEERTSRCNDGVVCREGYVCTSEGDGCRREDNKCGNGKTDPGEVCDDGNVDALDDCSNDCKRQRKCGDGVRDKDKGEECDEGTPDSKGNPVPRDTPTCDSDCTRPACGDGYVNSTFRPNNGTAVEACDDGERNSDDTYQQIGRCTTTCQKAPYCGDGKIDTTFDEECDGDGLGHPGETDKCNLSNKAIQSGGREMLSTDCRFARCGDGYVNEDNKETCDGDGNGTPGEINGCNLSSSNGRSRLETDCHYNTCGDGYTNKQEKEECDDGTENNQGEWDNGGSVAGYACTAQCKKTPKCGDDIPNAPFEKCDDGDRNSDAYSLECKGTCAKNCQFAPCCGDGVLHPSEQCDDGNRNNDDDCTNECKGNTCGNGKVEAGEDCDDGNTNNQDDCVNLALKSATTCTTSGDIRSVAECHTPANQCRWATCRDGFKHTDSEANATNPPPLEDCDEGPFDTENCVAETCKQSICGDGHINVKSSEQCEPGDEFHPRCDEHCRIPNCGDSVVNPLFEECDPGIGPDGKPQDTDDCDSDCTRPQCGDGHPHQSGYFLNKTDPASWRKGEDCDSGGVDTDTCDADCTWRECGDGYQSAAKKNNALIEACETTRDSNGKPINSAGCTKECAIPRCGDGITWLLDFPAEQCDAGDAGNAFCNGSNAGKFSCELSTLGDGYVNPPAGEECDDGNTQSGDGCTDEGKRETGWECPNGGGVCWVNHLDCHLVANHEDCADQNSNDSDGCSSEGRTEAGWTCAPPVQGICGTCTAIHDDFLIVRGEDCADGNDRSDDGCSSASRRENGWNCPNQNGRGGPCTAICGDGSRVGKEQCDPPNGGSCTPRDDASASPGCQCNTAAGWQFDDIQKLCVHNCGNGRVDQGESCDDAGAAGSCNAQCTGADTGYVCTISTNKCVACISLTDGELARRCNLPNEYSCGPQC